MLWALGTACGAGPEPETVVVPNTDVTKRLFGEALRAPPERYVAARERFLHDPQARYFLDVITRGSASVERRGMAAAYLARLQYPTGAATWDWTCNETCELTTEHREDGEATIPAAVAFELLNVATQLPLETNHAESAGELFALVSSDTRPERFERIAYLVQHGLARHMLSESGPERPATYTHVMTALVEADPSANKAESLHLLEAELLQAASSDPADSEHDAYPVPIFDDVLDGIRQAAQPSSASARNALEQALERCQSGPKRRLLVLLLVELGNSDLATECLSFLDHYPPPNDAERIVTVMRGTLGEQDFVSRVEALVTGTEPRGRFQAAVAARFMNTQDGVALLNHFAADDPEVIRFAVLSAAQKFACESAPSDALRSVASRYLRDSSEFVRAEASLVLARLAGRGDAPSKSLVRTLRRKERSARVRASLDLRCPDGFGDGA